MSNKTRRGLASWLTSTRTPVFVLDERRVVLVFNQGCELLTQWNSADVIGKVCHFQSEPNPELIESVTSALCPPQEVVNEEVLIRRTVFTRRDLRIVERQIHYFPLLPNSEEGRSHLLGIILPCSEAIEFEPDLHLQVSRHLAANHVKYGIKRLVTLSPAMQRVASQINIANKLKETVHIAAEPGSGREHVARMIHYSGLQSSSRFVPVRCQTGSHYELEQLLTRIADPLTDHEIGTVYLEDIQSLPGNLQPLVLQLVLSGRYRVISSSIAGLDGVADQLIGRELRNLLTSIAIQIPPLRSRGEDVPLLAQQILEEGNTPTAPLRAEFAPAVLKAFQKYVWPGNVEELERVILKARQTATGTVIEMSDLPFEFLASAENRTVRPKSPSESLDDQLMALEKRLIQQAMLESRENKSAAAERLGIPRAKLYRRMEQLGLIVSDDDILGDDGVE
ncbi:sigma 54-interacting transcriptional regulator [Planctomicrobium sp. SH668]|uniref:sigma 54-interacting transcriptional regulator n=1 Tax=Planctomicrobium sp. SH668 TaxID=3448126 RepID=UPI003F5C3313